VIRRATDRVLAFLRDQDPGALFVVTIGLVIVAAAPFLVVMIAAPPTPQDDLPFGIDEIHSPDVRDYTNIPAGYGFSYPSTWELDEGGSSARLESPGGNTVVSFGSLGVTVGLDAATEGLIEALPGSRTSQELIGTTRERIAGSPSLLTSGTATDRSGRPIRFLAIAVRGDVRTYAITIVVPAGSDPSRVLPRVERVVSSFQILDDGDVIPSF
jgi:hypothetical protein